MRFVFYCLLFCLPAHFLAAVSWSILPVRTINIQARDSKSGPLLLPDARANANELARAMVNYLEITGYRSVSSPANVERVFKSLRLRANQKITKSNLRDLGIRLDSDQLLLTTIVKGRDGFQIESRVFYANTQAVANTMVTRHSNLWVAISRHVEKRFGTNLPFTLKPKSKRPILLLLDASGSNYQEINEIKKIMPLVNTSFSGACSVDGQGRLSFSKLGEHPQRLKKYLSTLRAGGGATYLKSFSKAIECAIRENPYQGNLADKPKVFISVSSMPPPPERSHVRALLNKLALSADLLILGSGSLNSEMQQYWRETANSLARSGRATYQNVLYRQSVGLADGSSWFIFKRGFDIIESKQKRIRQNKAGIRVPSHLKKNFTASGLLAMYKKLSKNQVVNAGSISVLLQAPILAFAESKSSASHNRRTRKQVRVLLEIDNKPFWISVPRSAIYNRSGRIRIKQNEKYYFLLNLQPGEKGIPFTNSVHFAKVYADRKKISRLLLLNLGAYLRNPNRFLNRSLASTSLYAVFGKVKLIRFSEKDAFDQ